MFISVCVYTVATVILGTYFGVDFLYYLKGKLSRKKSVKDKPSAASSSVSTGSAPPIDSPDFPTFVESDAFLKLLDNEDQPCPYYQK